MSEMYRTGMDRNDTYPSAALSFWVFDAAQQCKTGK
jgi:hypothetical protein